jgi:hypothetical protein
MPSPLLTLTGPQIPLEPDATPGIAFDLEGATAGAWEHLRLARRYALEVDLSYHISPDLAMRSI